MNVNKGLKGQELFEVRTLTHTIKLLIPHNLGMQVVTGMRDIIEQHTDEGEN